MVVRVRREVPRKGFLVGRPGSICRRVLRMSRGWTMMVERRPAERPATLGVLLERGSKRLGRGIEEDSIIFRK